MDGETGDLYKTIRTVAPQVTFTEGMTAARAEFHCHKSI